MDDTDSKLEEVAADGEMEEQQPSSASDEQALLHELEDECDLSGTHRGSGGSLIQYVRRRLTAAALAIEQLVRTRERIWTTAISTLIASISMLLVGFTVGFSSASVLQLQELPSSRRFDTVQIHFYVVSVIKCTFITLLVFGYVCNVK